MRFARARGRLTVVLAAALACTALSPAWPAHADNYSGATGSTGCDGGLNEADNATHTFHYVDLADHNANATDWARTNVVNPTTINTSYDSTLDSLTDVVVRDQRYADYCGYDWLQPGDSGIVGLASCDDDNSANECERHTVRYNINFTAGASTDNRRGLACHEIGHTLGLAHRTSTTSCMQQDYPKPALAYSAHDRVHLNDNY